MTGPLRRSLHQNRSGLCSIVLGSIIFNLPYEIAFIAFFTISKLCLYSVAILQIEISQKNETFWKSTKVRSDYLPADFRYSTWNSFLYAGITGLIGGDILPSKSSTRNTIVAESYFWPSTSVPIDYGLGLSLEVKCLAHRTTVVRNSMRPYVRLKPVVLNLY